MSEAEKGEYIGSAIGKYGVEIFAGGVAIKGVSVCNKGINAFRNLRNANRVCNLEGMAVSNANKTTITSAALQHASKRENFFNEVRIEWNKQNKHVIGKHNFENGRGTFEHADAQALLSKYAGKGTQVRGEPGFPGYKERVDFGEFIGHYVDEKNVFRLPTTRGIIHYSKNGAHIVPAHPNGS